MVQDFERRTNSEIDSMIESAEIQQSNHKQPAVSDEQMTRYFEGVEAALRWVQGDLDKAELYTPEWL